MAVVSTGYQMPKNDAFPAVPFISFGIKTNATIKTDAKLTTNHGTIWTNTIVLRVAKLAFFEFIPIHIPNQLNAIRLPRVVTTPATEMTATVRPIGGDAVGDLTVAVTVT